MYSIEHGKYYIGAKSTCLELYDRLIITHLCDIYVQKSIRKPLSKTDLDFNSICFNKFGTLILPFFDYTILLVLN